MIEARKVANKIEDEREKALEYSTKIFCYLDDIRYHVDKLELIVTMNTGPSQIQGIVVHQDKNARISDLRLQSRPQLAGFFI